MEFVRDQAKSEASLRERGFDFAFATLIFDAATLEVEDTRRDYGEQRMVAVGLPDGLHVTVVYTDRRQPKGRLQRRIISARRSNRRGRRAYDAALGA